MPAPTLILILRRLRLLSQPRLLLQIQVVRLSHQVGASFPQGVAIGEPAFVPRFDPGNANACCWHAETTADQKVAEEPRRQYPPHAERGRSLVSRFGAGGHRRS
jgi:hypothetical protein